MPKIFILTLLLLQFNISALEVRSVIWGFDNTIKENSFNLLTFEIFNDTGDVYDDYISVSEASFNKEVVTRRKLFLNSGQKKTIQLSCYVGQSFRGNGWNLSWKGGKVTVQSPVAGKGSDIYLSRGAFTRNLPKGLKLFQANHFPGTVSLTRTHTI